MDMVGAAVITIWALGLLKETAPVLLDASIDEPEQHFIKAAVEQDSDNQVSDMHVWKVGANHYAAIISVVTHYPTRHENYKNMPAAISRALACHGRSEYLRWAVVYS